MAGALRGLYELAGALAWAWGLPAAHLPPCQLPSPPICPFTCYSFAPCHLDLCSSLQELEVTLSSPDIWLAGEGAGLGRHPPDRRPPLGPRPPPSLAGESPSQMPWVYKTREMVRGRGQRIPEYSGLQKRLLQVGNCRQDHHPGFPRLGRAAVIWGPARTPTHQGATEAETARAPQLNVAGPCRCP